MRSVAVGFVALLALSSPVSAQAPNDRVKLDISRAELQIIGQGLMELPYKTVAPVINDLQAQLNAADAAAMKAAADAKAAAEKPKEAKPEEKPIDNDPAK